MMSLCMYPECMLYGCMDACIVCGAVMGEGGNSDILETVHAYMGVHCVPVYERAISMCVLYYVQMCTSVQVCSVCLFNMAQSWLRTKSHPLWKLCE